jgi:hypothetical protein
MSPFLCATISSITLLAQTPPNPPAPAPPAPAAAEKLHFATGMTPGAVRLIEVKGRQSGSMKVAVGSIQREMRPHAELHYQVVDTMEEPGSHVWKGWRRFVTAEETVDNAVADPEYTGLEADLWFDRDNQIHFETRHDRCVASHHLKDLIDTAVSFGLCVPLPEALAPGEEADVDFSGLAGWCFQLIGKTTVAKAHLRFDRVDPKANVALFTGTVHVEETIDQTAEESGFGAPTTGTGTHDGKIELTFDLAGRRVSRITCKGHGRSDGSTRAKSTGSFVAELDTEVMLTCAEGIAAAAALKQKPKVRDVPRELEKCGVVLTLPSDYFKNVAALGEPTDDFIAARDGMKKVVMVRVHGVESSAALKETAESLGKSLQEAVPGHPVTEGATTSGLGAGRRFEFTQNGMKTTSHLLSLGDNRYVCVTFVAPESEWAAHASEWSKILQVLKKIPAKK